MMNSCVAMIVAGAVLVGCGDAPEPEAPVVSETGGQVAAKNSECDPYLKFCIKAKVSGAAEVSGVTGFGGSEPCAKWAAGGVARVLELPTMLPMPEKNPITVALTRIAAYTGPGEYTLVSTRQGSIPDALPALDTGERSFGDGTGSMAKVMIKADGSGSLEASNLVEIKAAHRTREPDPAARVSLSRNWTCRDL